jgi:hypothetical protein
MEKIKVILKIYETKGDIREKKIAIESNNIENVLKTAPRFLLCFSFENMISAIGRNLKNLTTHDKRS